MRRVEDPSAPRSVTVFRDMCSGEEAHGAASSAWAAQSYRRPPPSEAHVIHVEHQALTRIGETLFVSLLTGLVAMAALREPSVVSVLIAIVGLCTIAATVTRIRGPRRIAVKDGALAVGGVRVDLRDIRSVQLSCGAFGNEIWLETSRSKTLVLLLDRIPRIDQARYIARLVAKKANIAQGATRTRAS